MWVSLALTTACAHTLLTFNVMLTAHVLLELRAHRPTQTMIVKRTAQLVSARSLVEISSDTLSHSACLYACSPSATMHADNRCIGRRLRRRIRITWWGYQTKSILHLVTEVLSQLLLGRLMHGRLLHVILL
mmetsp:Transcript_43871/g.106542  ORF Transcript_43871/g.106542 Transcript_43871/m.106542 type:complete len:131 (+) Transcript_43871:438-830(+)